MIPCPLLNIIQVKLSGKKGGQITKKMNYRTKDLAFIFSVGLNIFIVLAILGNINPEGKVKALN